MTDQLELLATFRKGESVDVRAYGEENWTSATVVRTNRARRVVIVTLFGVAGTRSIPLSAVRRPPPAPPAPLPPRKPAKAELVAAGAAVAKGFSSGPGPRAAGGISFSARRKVQTWAPASWGERLAAVREHIRRRERGAMPSEGEVVRQLLGDALDRFERETGGR